MVIGEDGTRTRVWELLRIITCFIFTCILRLTLMRRLFIFGSSFCNRSTLRPFILRWDILRKLWCPFSSMSSQNAPKYLSFIELDLWGTYGKLWGGCTNVLISPATIIDSREQVTPDNVKQEEAEQNIKPNFHPRLIPWLTNRIYLQLHLAWTNFQVHS